MDRAHILIVEDDTSLRLVLADNLEEEGYRVTATPSGDQARRLLLGEDVTPAPLRDGVTSVPLPGDAECLDADLVILDIMLPDRDGYSLCRELRARGLETPVLMLTARTLEDDLVQGFDAGADDYLTKPYRLRELLVRVRALLRRRAGPPGEALAEGGKQRSPRRGANEIFRFAGFRLDLAARSLRDPHGSALELTRTEFDLLALFLARQGEALSRDRILDQVWGRDVVVDGRTVDNFVSSLKKKLGWRRTCRFRFKTLRGVGYRMEVDR